MAAVPEPCALALAVAALIGFAAYVSTKRGKRQPPGTGTLRNCRKSGVLTDAERHCAGLSSSLISAGLREGV